MGEKVTAVINMETRRLVPGTVEWLAKGLWQLVSGVERELRIVNTVGESWPMDELRTWAPDREEGLEVGLQREQPSDVERQEETA